MFSAMQKLHALKLLNKIIMKKNPGVIRHVEKVLLSDLVTLAKHNHSRSVTSCNALLMRGSSIFGSDEADAQTSSHFLIILLGCIERWALTF